MSITLQRNRLTHGLNLDGMTGIEIGPLVNPVVTREMSDVRYVDRASTADLKEWYAKDPSINVEEITDIDYIWGEQSLSQATGGEEQFDYVIASHVIEHIPDLITWLMEISSVLKSGGIACFSVPDKRYTFDFLRSPTQLPELIDNYLNKIRKPSVRHIFDHFSLFSEVNIQDAWTDDFDGSALKPTNSLDKVFKSCLQAVEEDKYVDSHCSVFTQDSFFELLAQISELGLFDFKLRRHFRVPNGMFEFYVQLEKLDPSLSKQDKHNEYLRSLKQLQNTYIDIEFTANVACQPKLYYDIGIGFNELETVTVNYTKPKSNSNLRFPLPVVKDVSLRFDPADGPGKFQISSVSLSDGDQKREVGLDQITAAQQIRKLQLSRGKLYIVSERNAADPACLITL